MGSLPTIRTEKDENQLDGQKQSSSYTLPMVEENEFNNSNLLETNRSYPVLPVMLKTKSSGGLVFSATDTYNLSASSSSSILESSKNTKKQSTDRNEDEEDEPTNPFVQSSPQRQD